MQVVCTVHTVLPRINDNVSLFKEVILYLSNSLTLCFSVCRDLGQGGNHEGNWFVPYIFLIAPDIVQSTSFPCGLGNFWSPEIQSCFNRFVTLASEMLLSSQTYPCKLALFLYLPHSPVELFLKESHAIYRGGFISAMRTMWVCSTFLLTHAF